MYHFIPIFPISQDVWWLPTSSFYVLSTYFSTKRICLREILNRDHLKLMVKTMVFLFVSHDDWGFPFRHRGTPSVIIHFERWDFPMMGFSHGNQPSSVFEWYPHGHGNFHLASLSSFPLSLPLFLGYIYLLNGGTNGDLRITLLNPYLFPWFIGFAGFPCNFPIVSPLFPMIVPMIWPRGNCVPMAISIVNHLDVR